MYIRKRFYCALLRDTRKKKGDNVVTREFTPADCLTVVEKSPAAVALHDKAAWLSLFARYNIVEDPVGSRPHLSGV